MDIVDEWLRYEREYNGTILIEWTRDHAELPIFAVALYLAMVTYGPTYMPCEVKLGWIFAFWNVGLAVFSVLGASRVVPHLVSVLQNKTIGETFQERFTYTCCTDPNDWYVHGPTGVWVGVSGTFAHQVFLLLANLSLHLVLSNVVR